MRTTVFTFLILFFSNSLCSQEYNENLMKGMLAFHEEEYVDAIDFFTKALENSDTEEKFSVLRYRAISFKRIHQYESSVKDFKKMYKIIQKTDNDNLKAYVLWSLGNLYSMIDKQKFKKKSLRYYLKANEYDYDKSNLLATIGYQYIEAGKAEDSFPYFIDALEIDSTNAIAYSNRAFAYAMISKGDLALIDANKAIKLSPDNPYAYKHRAMALILLARIDDACQDLQKAKDLDFNSYFYENDESVDKLIEEYCSHGEE